MTRSPRPFSAIYQTAVLHKGSVQAVENSLPKAKTAKQLRAVPDHVYLSEMARRIFRAGLKHEMVDKKWPAFEVAFHGFDPFTCAMLSDEQIERLMDDRRLIRHAGKIKAVRENAKLIQQIARENGSFGNFLANWPEDEVVELWFYLKKHGKQLGGNSGPYFLRMIGRDTFLLTTDVVSVVKNEIGIDKTPTAKSELLKIQELFKHWKVESGRSFCEISRIVSYGAV